MKYGLKQTPAPDTKLLKYRGETITFELKTPKTLHGKAYLRTNLGNAKIRRNEIIKSAENGFLPSGKDWHDIEMKKIEDGFFRLKLPLTQTGFFAAKTLFIKPDGKVDWPCGENVLIKTEPADTICHNTIYTVFPRQFAEFAKNKSENGHSEYSDTIKQLDKLGYTVIPPSGTFADVAKELDFIVDKLGFKIVQLLPIHPTPTVFMRMGRYGSPFAATDFYNVDPLTARQVRNATPMEQFVDFADKVHAKRAKVFIDLPANHTGWASLLQIHHPQWFKREKDKTFISPGAWGVTWEDLCELDYENTQLQNYMANVFLYWARKGVDGFRCDAGYMIPIKAWDFIVAKVRNEFPDTIFMLEGLGGKLSVTNELLSRSNLNWAYSELFQNYTPQEITGYLDYANDVSEKTGTLVNFAETHDNNRLAEKGKEYSKMRTAMCAMFSCAGAFGITNGVEWFAKQKVDVHGASALNWASEDNQIQLIKRLNSILKHHCCFLADAKLKFIHNQKNQSIALLRQKENQKVLVAVNIDTQNSTTLSWNCRDFDTAGDNELYDLISEEKFSITRNEHTLSLPLAPASVVVLSQNKSDIEMINQEENSQAGDMPAAIKKQNLAACVTDSIVKLKGFNDISDFDIDRLCGMFAQNPNDFFNQIYGNQGYIPLVNWSYPADKKRELMLPPKHFLRLCADEHFLVSLTDKNGTVLQRSKSIKLNDSTHTAILDSFNINVKTNTRYYLAVKVYGKDQVDTFTSTVKILCEGEDNVCIDINKLPDDGDYAICCGNLGAMAQVRAKWGTLQSKYDAFLAANLNPQFPVDRHIMLTRLRAWVVYRDYSSEISAEFQTSFTTDMNNKVSWRFDLPVGLGKNIPLAATLNFSKTSNAADIVFTRLSANCPDCLDDGEVVKIVIRPDIEDRCNHEVTKAYKGAEFSFPAAINAFGNGFIFNTGENRSLALTSENNGKFIKEPEWEYMVGLPVEAQRGLESSTDLFSPGYFKFKLSAGDAAVVKAQIATPGAESRSRQVDKMPAVVNKNWAVKDLLAEAMKFYMVKRGKHKTAIAGFPWFLDWGRDTFIALRGFISASLHSQCRDIINQFARYEENGTLPNMIRGEDVSNRDTTDAPLWMFTAVSDYINATDDRLILDDDCNGRTLLEVLKSIAHGYIKGTSNGIKACPKTMLIYSPPHFTWMDTNYPAATPREGYPIEIQALWFAALGFLQQYDTENSRIWSDIRQKVRTEAVRLYRCDQQTALSDCLHAKANTPADQAIKDDALRPNQLFAITLGLIEDKDLGSQILNACSALLIPASIRSLADRELKHPLAVYNNGKLLNNPNNPYFDIYGGQEDITRKPAYHNGTAWGWVFPSYCEAMLKVHGSSAAPAAKSIMLSIIDMLKSGCIGHLPEICDGSYPHSQRGCGAQAWSVTEAYRILKML